MTQQRVTRQGDVSRLTAGLRLDTVSRPMPGYR